MTNQSAEELIQSSKEKIENQDYINAIDDLTKAITQGDFLMKSELSISLDRIKWYQPLHFYYVRFP